MFSTYSQINTSLAETKNNSLDRLFPNKSNYLHLLITAELDWADYVLIVTALLKEILGQKIENELNDIQQMFVKNQKTDAMELILKICEEHSEITRNRPLLKCIQSKITTLNDSPMLLDGRRYFETQFSLEMWKSLGDNEFKTMTKLSALITDIDPTIVIPAVVRTLAEAERVIDLMEKCVNTKEVHEKEESLRQLSDLYRSKDRGIKRIATNVDAS